MHNAHNYWHDEMITLEIQSSHRIASFITAKVHRALRDKILMITSIPFKAKKGENSVGTAKDVIDEVYNDAG